MSDIIRIMSDIFFALWKPVPKMLEKRGQTPTHASYTSVRRCLSAFFEQFRNWCSEGKKYVWQNRSLGFSWRRDRTWRYYLIPWWPFWGKVTPAVKNSPCPQKYMPCSRPGKHRLNIFVRGTCQRLQPLLFNMQNTQNHGKHPHGTYRTHRQHAYA